MEFDMNGCIAKRKDVYYVRLTYYHYLWDRDNGAIVPGTKQEHEAFSAYLKDVTWQKEKE